MVTNDATILKLKHEVLYAVSKAAWEDDLKHDHGAAALLLPGRQGEWRV